jgi:hypothetical protein
MPSLDMHALDTADPAVAEQARAQLTSFTALLQSLMQVGGAAGAQDTGATAGVAATPSVSVSVGSPVAAEASHTSSGSGPLVLVPPVGASGAAGATFRELLLHRHIPSHLAAYLLDAFTRPDIDSLWPGGMSDVSGMTPPSTMHSSRYARRTVETLFSGASSLAGTPRGRAVTAAGGGSTVDLATTPRSHRLAQHQHQSPGPQTPRAGPGSAGPGGMARSLTLGSAGATPSSAGAGAAVLPPELTPWCVPLGSAGWKAALDRPGVLHALQLLLSMAAGHEPTAQQICSVPAPIVPDADGSEGPLHTPRETGHSVTSSPGRGSQAAGVASSGVMSSPLLHLLHLMEGVAGGATIAPLAESLLDTLAAASPAQGVPASQSAAASTSGGAAPATSGQATTSIAAAVASIRDATKARMRELAQRRRQAMLTSMGMSPGRRSEGQASSVPAGGAAGAEGPSGTMTPVEGTTPSAQQRAPVSSATWSPAEAGSTPPAQHPAGGSGSGHGPSGAQAAGNVQVGFQVAGEESGSAGAQGGEAVGSSTPAAASAAVAIPPPPVGLPPSPSPSPGTQSAAPGTTPRTGPPSARGRLSSLLLSPQSPAGSQLAAELAALEAEEEEGEEEGEEVRCMVCREGYRLRPRELLCAYVYCKALHIPTVSTSSTSSSSSSSSASAAVALEAALSTPGGHPALFMPPGSPCAAVYSTVTHFNLIHASCHASARTADASLRAPKREWDGATLRNGDVSHAGLQMFCFDALPGVLSCMELGCT